MRPADRYRMNHQQKYFMPILQSMPTRRLHQMNSMSTQNNGAATGTCTITSGQKITITLDGPDTDGRYTIGYSPSPGPNGYQFQDPSSTGKIIFVAPKNYKFSGTPDPIAGTACITCTDTLNNGTTCNPQESRTLQTFNYTFAHDVTSFDMANICFKFYDANGNSLPLTNPDPQVGNDGSTTHIY